MSVAETKPDHTNGQSSDETVQRSLELPPELTAEDVETIKQLISFLRKRNGSTRPVPQSLTQDETQVLSLVASGKNIQQISRALEITQREAQAHRESIEKKLNSYSIADLITSAVLMGLVEL